jgi:hypothetical protein
MTIRKPKSKAQPKADRKPSAFDVVDNLMFGKQEWLYKSGIIDKDYLKSYCRFVVDHAMSMSLDTLTYAQDMNERPWLDADMQHDYYFFGVRKSKRYAKWYKRDTDDCLDAVMAEYQVGPVQGRYIVSILKPEQLAVIKDRQSEKQHGGKINPDR